MLPSMGTSILMCPLLDRIDIQVEAAAVNYNEFGNSNSSDTSENIKARVMKATAIQTLRYKDEKINFNGQLSASQIEKYCRLGIDEQKMLEMVFKTMDLSVRAYHKILKVSRTIADLSGHEDIKANHLAEAVQYRSLDRKYWG